jgi:DNA-binding transcriptional LysR family regulator
MDIVQLRYFLAASETDNFTAAAKRCYTSRQNLTRSIRNLEDELGTTLFTRTGNTTHLTSDGERAVEHARAIVDEAQILEDLFKSADNTDLMHVLLSTNSNMFLPKQVLDNAFSANTTISEYSPSDCFKKIVDGEFDVAFTSTMARDFPGCNSVLVRRSSMCYLVAKNSSLAGKRSMGVEDLDGRMLCLMAEPAFAYRQLLSRYQELGMDLSRIRKIDNIPLLLNEMRQKDAVAIAAFELRERPLKDTVAVPCAESFMEACVYALYQRNSKNISRVLRLISSVRKLSNEAGA